MSETGIKYSGRVVLTKYRNGKKIGTRMMHNNGTFLLFRYLCRCLSRTDSVENREKPFSLDLCYYDNNNTLISLLVSGIKPVWADSTVQYTDESGNSSCYVEYTFYVSSGNINSGAVGSIQSGQEQNGVPLVYVLRDETGDLSIDGNVLATVKEDDFDARTLTISTNEVWAVKWRMTLQNAQGE